MVWVGFQAVCEEAGVKANRAFALASDLAINGISSDSRRVSPGDLFVCMPSKARDTHEFIPGVKQAGAAGVVVRSKEALDHADRLGLAAVLVQDIGHHFNFGVSRICRAVLDDPTRDMKVIGVTGTNGKTTTAWMIHGALTALGRRAAYMGTIGYTDPEGTEKLENTTPFPVDLWNLLARARDSKCGFMAMEASSHALYERRLASVQFDVGVFTNLTQDHLDFHGSMEAYSDAKRLLFTEYVAASNKAFTGAFNAADAVTQQWQKELLCDSLTFGTLTSDLRVEAKSVMVNRIELSASFGGEKVDFYVPVGGLFNVQNASSALASLLALGLDLKVATEGLSQVTAVPGRFEAVQNDMGLDVIVDYAHTPDALEQLLASARQLNPSKIITVFGCGGNRDKSKRPKMAAVASRLSELTIATSDNPREEDPEDILNDVCAGLLPGREFERIVDRREAIARAMRLAGKGDLIVIAGKGHEDYQIIGRTKHHMDDRELVREAATACSD